MLKAQVQHIRELLFVTLKVIIYVLDRLRHVFEWTRLEVDFYFRSQLV